MFTARDGAKPTRLRDARSEIRYRTTRWRPISNVSVTDEREVTAMGKETWKRRIEWGKM